MKEYSAVVFDLFDTVVDFDPQKMPLVVMDGHEVRTTCARLFEIMSNHYDRIDFPSFYRAWMEALKEVRAETEATHLEITAPQRFQKVFSKLNLPDGHPPRGILDELLRAHMDMLAAATVFPAERKEILLALQDRYKLGLVSNFDYSPTVHKILSMYGIGDLFGAIIVSADLGIRKPRAEIFQKALEIMGLSPAEALFVGDTYKADILGAKSAGMDAAWIDRGASSAPSSAVAPDYRLMDFKELINVLRL